jgi:hypothetical protein
MIHRLSNEALVSNLLADVALGVLQLKEAGKNGSMTMCALARLAIEEEETTKELYVELLKRLEKNK